MLPVCAGTLATTSRLACLFGLVITKNEGMSLTEIRRRWHRRQRRFCRSKTASKSKARGHHGYRLRVHVLTCSQRDGGSVESFASAAVSPERRSWREKELIVKHLRSKLDTLSLLWSQLCLPKMTVGLHTPYTGCILCGLLSSTDQASVQDIRCN